LPKCPVCHWKYPGNLLNQMFIATSKSSSGYTDAMCAICALEYINSVHGLTDTKFRGRMAEANRIAALKWRQTHPNDAPVEVDSRD
jgi:hypothetical protein